MLIERREHLQQLEERVREQTLAIRSAHEETIERLMAAAACRDEETSAHIRRTELLSAVLATSLGWSPDRVDLIRMAAPMHDIGKIGIPDAVLQKPGRLTAAEYDIMKTHTVIGAGLLDGASSAILQMAHTIARHHHERWDGSGYPSGLRGDAIPVEARIVAIVDVFDAISHDRVYRPALPEAESLQIMKDGCGTHFDPKLLESFFMLYPEMA